MKGAAGARNARHDGANGDIEDQCDVFVLEPFDITKKEDLAEGWLKLIEGLIHGCLVVETDEVIFRCRAGIRGAEDVGMIFQKNCA